MEKQTYSNYSTYLKILWSLWSLDLEHVLQVHMAQKCPNFIVSDFPPIAAQCRRVQNSTNREPQHVDIDIQIDRLITATFTQLEAPDVIPIRSHFIFYLITSNQIPPLILSNDDFLQMFHKALQVDIISQNGSAGISQVIAVIRLCWVEF